MITIIVLGLVTGIVSSSSGLGGGFLVVPFLVYLGHQAKTAVGTSLLFVLLAACSSVVAHLKAGNVELKTGLLLAAGGILGAQLGPMILQHTPDPVFKRVFSVCLVCAGVWLFVNAKA